MTTKQKVLVIDDEHSALRMFRMYLKIYGYEPLLALDGEEGLALFKEHLPEIVFTDIKMPGIDGLTVLKKIKEIRPQTEVIIITGHGDFDLAIKALHLDATDFLNKPFGKEEIESALARAKKRLSSSGPAEKSFELSLKEDKAVIKLNVYLTSQTVPILKSLWEQIKQKKNVKQLELLFSPDLSVNGAGITFLSDLKKEAKELGIDVIFSNISKQLSILFKEIQLI